MALPGFIVEHQAFDTNYILKLDTAGGFLGPATVASSDTSVTISMGCPSCSSRWRCITETRDACIEGGFEKYGGLDCSAVAYASC